MELTPVQWLSFYVEVACSLIITILAIKNMNEDNLFDKTKRSKRILFRFILLIFSPIIVPIVFVIVCFYFLYDWLINVMFE